MPHQEIMEVEESETNNDDVIEIEDIKNSTNRVLKAKLRKSKNTVEVNVYATMIIMENMNSESTEEESK